MNRMQEDEICERADTPQSQGNNVKKLTKRRHLLDWRKSLHHYF